MTEVCLYLSGMPNQKATTDEANVPAQHAAQALRSTRTPYVNVPVEQGVRWGVPKNSQQTAHPSEQERQTTGASEPARGARLLQSVRETMPEYRGRDQQSDDERNRLNIDALSKEMDLLMAAYRHYSSLSGEGNEDAALDIWKMIKEMAETKESLQRTRAEEFTGGMSGAGTGRAGAGGAGPDVRELGGEFRRLREITESMP